MNKYLEHKYFPLAALALILALWTAGSTAYGKIRSIRDKQKVVNMTDKMKTVCVGRFLIDLPEQTEYQLNGGFLDGFDIRVYPETEEAFKASLAEREAKLRNPEPEDVGKVKLLEVAKDIQVEDYRGKMFVFGRDTVFWFEGPEKRVESTSVKVEVHAHANGFSAVISNSQAYPDRLDWPLTILSQIRLNPGNRIPDEPGFCIDHAYLREPLTADQGERVTMLAGLKAHPDMTMMFDMTAGTKPEKEGLLDRTRKSDEADSQEEKARIKTLNAGPRALNGIPGEQVLQRYIERNSRRTFAFMWDSPGTDDDVFRPALWFELQAGVNREAGGKPVGSSLSDDALLDLWNKITSSIRVRPTASAKTAATEPATPPLGTLAAAGATCPQSGWWQCGDGGDGVRVQGGQRQYIRQGERMPQALLLPPQTLWEKVRGLQSSYEARTPTAWTLVDKRVQRRAVSIVPLAQATAVVSTANTVPDAGQQATVGSYAATGKACAASGWWRCEEPHALDGTRWFAQGSVLPAATFAVPAGVFGNAPGKIKAIRRHGTWQLMRLADLGPEPLPES